ncbi:hypothetical protein [Lentilactobacillus kefiri]|nr:hypothetical protein [Lentilactobacillus kefiri]MCJ2162516.1 hypothetical protein [Lentilactobacillus kefiri]MCP9370092.1 hypothetical protein [Lentilactobacillus kefiri]MDH5109434.1 hypothetical protein [Lentilactobacillus kefiri]MDM7493460.1 hypothetical protein [Lentilactobacillus kefiri]PAK58577.1 hypothetical protein B9K02_10770 [Lentilactobacillus kefiri]
MDMEQHVFRDKGFYLEYNNGRIYFCDKDKVEIRCNKTLQDYYELIEYYIYVRCDELYFH